MAVIPVAATVKVAGAAFGHHRDLRAGRTPVLRLVIAGEYAEFLDRIETDGGELVAVVPGVHITYTDEREVVLVGTSAVGGDGADSPMAGRLQVRSRGHTRHQRDQRQIAAPVNRDILQYLGIHGLGTLATLGLQQHGGGDDFDRLIHRAYFQRHITQRQILVSLEN